MAAGTGAQVSLWRLPAMRALVGASLLGFVSFSLTIASLPAHAVAEGARLELAGLVTTVMLLTTVVSQAGVPALVRRLGTGRVFAGGLVALGAPAPLYVLDAGVPWLSAVSAVRGSGFAVLTVLGFTLAAQLVGPERRGEALGVYGLSLALPNLAAVPAGVALTLAGHFPVVAWAAAVPLTGLVLVPAIVRARPTDLPAVPEPTGGVVAAARSAAAPALLLTLATLTGGGLVTFLPIERPDGVTATTALLVVGLASAVTRWRVGVVADRVGTRLLMPGSLLLAALGIGVVALGLVLTRGGSAVVVAGALLFGAGYGALQNLTLLSAFAKAGAHGTAAASAVWNASFDLGTAIGALAVGAVGALVGLPWTFALLTAVLVAVLPLALASSRTP